MAGDVSESLLCSSWDPHNVSAVLCSNLFSLCHYRLLGLLVLVLVFHMLQGCPVHQPSTASEAQYFDKAIQYLFKLDLKKSRRMEYYG